MIGLLHKSSRVSSQRSGATLTEVLMAILIMSIGVTSVFTLFPISIVRSIKATQQTNANLFKQNITELLRLRPELLYQHATAVPIASGNAPAASWRAGNAYAVGDVIAATTPNEIVPQLYAAAGRNDHLNVFPPPGYPVLPVGTVGRSGPFEPSWLLPFKWSVPFDDGVYTNDGPPPVPTYMNNAGAFVRTLDTAIQGDPHGTQLVWVPFPGHFLNQNASGYVVDPLGYWEAYDAEGAIPIGIPPASFFGKRVARDGISPTFGDGLLSDSNWNSVPGWGTVANGNITMLPRINGGIRVGGATPIVETTIAAARSFFGLPDTWAANTSTTATAFTPVAVAVGPPVIPPFTFDIDLPLNFNDVPTPGSGSRIVLTTEDGQSYATTNYGIQSSTPFYTVRVTIPSGFISPTTGVRITQVRFEAQDTRYTWLATVNNSLPGTSVVNVAIMFSRKFTLGEEHVYKAVWGNAATYYDRPPLGDGLEAPWSNPVDYSADPDLGPPTADGTVAGLGENQVVLAWDSSAEPTPIVAEGDYVFDAVNVDWYKVVDVPLTPTGAGNKKYFVLTLDQPVRVPTLNANAALPQSGVGRLILFRGIVGLYELTY